MTTTLRLSVLTLLILGSFQGITATTEPARPYTVPVNSASSSGATPGDQGFSLQVSFN